MDELQEPPVNEQTSAPPQPPPVNEQTSAPPQPPENGQTSAPPIFNGETGCKIAKIDGWHDHHTISGLDPEKFVVGHLPYTSCIHPHRSEDKFMWNNLLKGYPGENGYTGVGSPAQGDDYCRPISNGIQDENKYTPLVSDRYQVGHIQLKSNEQRDNSLIQSLLSSQGINDDIYFFKDTGLGNFADDIHRWEGPSNAYFLITSQAQFDPGPTTTCFTDGGERQGMGTDVGRNHNVFMGVYDWDNPNEMCTNYPKYPHVDNTPYDYPLEGMIYTKFQCHMLSNIEPIQNGASRNQAKKMLEKSNTTLYILDPEKTEKGALYGSNKIKSVFKVDKNTSDKATTLSEIVKSVSIDISKSGLDKSIIDRFDMKDYEKLYTQDGIYKLLSKKYGDHAHALKAAMNNVYFKKFEYNPDDGSGTFTINSEMSNGVHAYVSIDRVAITSAIIYGVPIVIYVTDNGFVIYISKNLINKYSTPEKQLEVLKSNVTILSSNVTNLLTKIAEISDDVLDTLKKKVEIIIGVIQPLITSITVMNDFEYHNLLTMYTIFSSIIKLYSRIHSSDHDSAKEVDRIVPMIPDTLTSSKDDLERVVPDLNKKIQDFNKIVTLKEKYDLIVFEFESILTKLDILNTIDYTKKLKKNPSLTALVQLVKVFDQTVFKKLLTTHCNDLIDKNIAIEIGKAIPFRTMTDPSSSRRLFCCKFGSPGLPTLAMPVIKHIYTNCHDSVYFKTYFIGQLNSAFTNIIVPGSNPNLDIKRIEMFEQFKADVNGTIDDTDITSLMKNVKLIPMQQGGSRKRKTKKRRNKQSGGNKQSGDNKRKTKNKRYAMYGGNGKTLRDKEDIKKYREMYSRYTLCVLLYKLVEMKVIEINNERDMELLELVLKNRSKIYDHLKRISHYYHIDEIFEPDSYEFNSFDSYIVGKKNENFLKYIHFYVAKHKKRFCKKGEECEDYNNQPTTEERYEYFKIFENIFKNIVDVKSTHIKPIVDNLYTNKSILDKENIVKDKVIDEILNTKFLIPDFVKHFKHDDELYNKINTPVEKDKYYEFVSKVLIMNYIYEIASNLVIDNIDAVIEKDGDPHITLKKENAYIQILYLYKNVIKETNKPVDIDKAIQNDGGDPRITLNRIKNKYNMIDNNITNTTYFSFGQMQRIVDICYDSEEVKALYDINEKYELDKNNISIQDFMNVYHTTIDSNLQQLKLKYNFELDISIFSNIMQYYIAEEKLKQEEAEEKLKQEEAARQKAETERLARLKEAERQEAERQAEEKLKQEEAEEKLKQEEASRQKAETERLARIEEERLAETERLARIEEEKLKQEEAEEKLKQEEAEEKLKQEEAARQKAETERLARIEEERQKQAERDRQKTRGISPQRIAKIKTGNTDHNTDHNTDTTKKRRFRELVVGGYKSSRKNKKYRKPRKYIYK